jgi:hypothetical protein
MADEPREYDREYTAALTSRTRVRIGYSHDHGDVTRFVVQLEYRLDVDEWREVVRYDHDPASDHGHDVTDEGLHIDIYRDGRKFATEFVASPEPAGIALDRAEEHLRRNHERFTERFETWHGIRNR